VKYPEVIKPSKKVRRGPPSDFGPPSANTEEREDADPAAPLADEDPA
jgi:hypothetical protein